MAVDYGAGSTVALSKVRSTDEFQMALRVLETVRGKRSSQIHQWDHMVLYRRPSVAS